MPSLKISQLPAATTLTGAELLPVVQGGTTKQTTTAEIAAIGEDRCQWMQNAYNSSPGGVFSNGRLSAESSIEGIGSLVIASLARKTGKFYFEVTANVVAGAGTPTVGLAQVNCTDSQAGGGATATTNRNSSWGLLATGSKYYGGTTAAYGSAIVAGDVVMVAVDFATGLVWWGKNGTWFASGNPAAGTNSAFASVTDYVYPAVTNSAGSKVTANFAGPFAHTAPSGFLAWDS
ncbi:MAG: SPRY domain-containing protein [Rhodanobacter sp.]